VRDFRTVREEVLIEVKGNDSRTSPLRAAEAFVKRQLRLSGDAGLISVVGSHYAGERGSGGQLVVAVEVEYQEEAR
jgi:hypothetical protein